MSVINVRLLFTLLGFLLSVDANCGTNDNRAISSNPESGVQCSEVLVKGANYGDCDGVYMVTNSSVPWARDRPVYAQRSKDRYIFWNKGGYGWSIGMMAGLVTGNHWHKSGLDSREPWQGEWGHGIQVSCLGDTRNWSSSQNDFSDSECPNLGVMSNDLQGCKDACLRRTNCTAFNYNAVTTTCVLRGCKIPVKGPSSNNHDDFDGFWPSSPGYANCVFPFVYNGFTYYHPTTAETDPPRFWCSINIQPGGRHERNKWVYTDSGTSTRGSRPCHFPFEYRGFDHYHCTDADHHTCWCGFNREHEAGSWGTC